MTEESYVAAGREFTNAGLVCLVCFGAFLLLFFFVFMACVELIL